MKIFETAAALAAATLAFGQLVETKGNLVAGDGGGAKYLITAGASPEAVGSPDLVNAVHAAILYSATPTVIQYGADPTGVVDSSPTFQAMVTLGGRILVPAGTYKIDASVVASLPVHLIGVGGSKIVPSLGLTGGKVFAFETDDVIVENLTIDAAGETFSPATGNTYAFFGGDGATKYYNHKYINNKILNMGFTDNNAAASNLKVSHGIYVDNVDDVVVKDNTIDTISGSCTFFRNNHGLSIRDNRFEDFDWYATQLTYNVKHWAIDNNQYLSGTAGGCYWGGAINIVSDWWQTQVSHGKITNNYFTGAYSYGAVLRLQSAKEVLVENNLFDGLSVGTDASSSTDLTGIRILTRGINTPTTGTHDGANNASVLTDSGESWVVNAFIGRTINNTTDGSSGIVTANTATTITAALSGGTDDDWDIGDAFTMVASMNEPCQGITVKDNYLHGGTGSATGNRHAIFVDNDYWETNNPAKGITIVDNHIYSPDTTNYWDDAIIISGQDGGVEDIEVINNYAEVYSQASPTVNGAIGFAAASATGACKGIKIGGNRLIDIGTPTSSYQLGIGYDAYTDEVFNISPNTIDNFYYGIRTFTNAGSVLNEIDDNYYLNIGLSNELLAVNPYRKGSATYDPASLGTGATAVTTVTAAGAALGNFAVASFSLDTQEIELSANVISADTVEVVFKNHNAGTIDLGSGTLKVKAFS